MAFRNFQSGVLSRRALLRGGAYAAAGGAVGSLPLGQYAFAREGISDWENVTRLVESYVERRKVPNMVASFGQGLDGELMAVARGKLGFGNKPAADLDSLYRIYSQTKPITGMATMICIDEGLIGMDQPVADLIPAFADMRVLKNPEGSLDDTVPAERPITIRHLLTHTAGLGYMIISKGPLLQAYVESGISAGAVSRIPIPGWPASQSAQGLEEWSERLAELPLVAQPGTKWSYSVSIDLLGRVIEVATGQKFEAFLQQRLFDPLGMNSTYFQVPESEVGRLTDNYGILGGVPIPVDPAASSVYLDEPPVIWGGAGLVSSPRDYDNFQRMLLGYGMFEGKQVMSERAVRIGTSNILPKGVDLAGTWLAGQGFGAAGRSVNNTFGWGGAAGTLSSVDYSVKLRAGLYVQYMPTNALPIRSEFVAAVQKDIEAVVIV